MARKFAPAPSATRIIPGTLMLDDDESDQRGRGDVDGRPEVADPFGHRGREQDELGEQAADEQTTPAELQRREGSTAGRRRGSR
jgi:hypothetical protein